MNPLAKIEALKVKIKEREDLKLLMIYQSYTQKEKQ